MLRVLDLESATLRSRLTDPTHLGQRLLLELVAFLSRNLPFRRVRWRFEAGAVELARAVRPLIPRRAVRTRHRFSLLVDVADHIGNEIFTRGEWEPGITLAVRALLEPGGVFVDVGAHIGYFTLLASKSVGRSGQIFAFEPVPRTRERLIANLRRNRVANCRVYGQAVWNKACEIRIRPGGPENTGLSSARPSAPSPEDLHVVAQPLDDVLPAELRIGLVKIDVEGAECHVLEGMTRCLRESRPDLIIEVSDAFLRELGRSAKMLVEMLDSYGYRMYLLPWAGAPCPVTSLVNHGSERVDVLFTMRDRLPWALCGG